MGVWDDIKSWFSNEDKDKVSDQDRIDEEQMTAYLEEMHKKFEQAEKDKFDEGLANSTPEPPEFPDYKNHSSTNDNNIEVIAKDREKDQYNKDKDKIDIDYDKKVNNSESLLMSEEAKRAAKETTIAKAAEESKTMQANSALERGIANSSIVGAAADEIDKAASASKESLIKEYQQKSDKLTAELEYLNSARELAHKTNDIKSLESIESRIKQMKRDRDNYNEDIDKYNKSIDKEKIAYDDRAIKLKANYLKEMERYEREAEAHELKYGYSGDKKKEYDERLTLALGFYNKMPKEKALKMIQTNPKLKEFLGSNLTILARRMHDRTK